MTSNSTGNVNRSTETKFLHNAITNKSRVVINTLEGLVIRAIIIAEDDVSIHVRQGSDSANKNGNADLNTSLISKKNIVRICMDYLRE